LIREKIMQLSARVLAFLGLFLVSGIAGAQGYPSRPIRLLVPFPPGASSDAVARSYSQKLGELLGQQIVVDYRAGAGGSIGASEVARAAPDGYTLLQVWDTHAVNHYVYGVQYDFFKSFEPISLLAQGPGILVAHPGFPASTLKALIDYAKANPDKVTYGSAGVGSSNHLSGLLFSQMAGVRMTHVPYKGGGPLITDIVGGHIDIVFGSVTSLQPYVKSAKLKGIAVLSRGRLPAFSDLPAASDTVSGFELKTWFGLLAPGGTPKDLVARLSREVARAFGDAEVKERLGNHGLDVVASSSEFFAGFLKRESDTLSRVIRDAGIKPE